MSIESSADVVLTGATGFIGSRLWAVLNAAGLTVRCVTRDARRASARQPDRAWVQADLSDPNDLDQALAGCRIAYYLVHGMAEHHGDFREREVAQARLFSAAAAKAGLERIVYLGGVAPDGPPSEHLASRLEVGEALRAGSVPTIELRAGMIVGAGSTSWLIVRDLAARLPAMVLPSWMRTRSQPVAVDDVLQALLAAGRMPLESSGWFDLPGPEVLSGKEILEQAAEAMGLRHPLMVNVPFLSPTLSSHWVRLVTRADWSVARELVLGLQHDLLARDDRFWNMIRHEARVPFRLAAKRALDDDRSGGSMNLLERGLESAVAALSRVGRRDRPGVPPGAITASVQEVVLPLNEAAFDRWRSAEAMKGLLVGYFQVAERSGVGLVRVSHREGAPSIALRWPGLPLIVMGAPRVDLSEHRRSISVPIAGGLIPARSDSATLGLALTRDGSVVRATVELRDYRGRGAHVLPLSVFYWFQSGLHERVGRRFLRAFARRWRESFS